MLFDDLLHRLSRPQINPLTSIKRIILRVALCFSKNSSPDLRIAGRSRLRKSVVWPKASALVSHQDQKSRHVWTEDSDLIGENVRWHQWPMFLGRLCLVSRGIGKTSVKTVCSWIYHVPRSFTLQILICHPSRTFLAIQGCVPGTFRLTHCLLPSTLSRSILNADQCQVQGTSDIKIYKGPNRT